jgi:hypothetical protein
MVEVVGFVMRTVKETVVPLDADAGPVMRSCGCGVTVPNTVNVETLLAEPT